MLYITSQHSNCITWTFDHMKSQNTFTGWQADFVSYTNSFEARCNELIVAIRINDKYLSTRQLLGAASCVYSRIDSAECSE